MQIINLFPGVFVADVNWYRSNAQGFHDQAFVSFSSASDAEWALHIMGKMLKNKFVKVYRSSTSQLNYFRSKLITEEKIKSMFQSSTPTQSRLEYLKRVQSFIDFLFSF